MAGRRLPIMDPQPQGKSQQESQQQPPLAGPQPAQETQEGQPSQQPQEGQQAEEAEETEQAP
jgi:hypothetical protein